MGHPLRLAWLLLPIWLAAAVLPPAGNAYVPVAGHLLKAAAEKRSAPSSAVVRQTRIVPAQKPGGTEEEFRETVFMRFPGLIRSELQTDQGKRVYLERSGTYRIADSQGVSQAPPDPMDIALRLLASPEAGAMQQVLARSGVDLSVASLGIFQGRIGYVLGARYPDESVPQVWFDKKTLLPFRWLLVRQTAEGFFQRTEIRYSAWQKTGELHYPRAMAFFFNERRIADVRVDRIDAGADVAYEQFSFERLAEQRDF